jgi:hypothetical protein
LGSLKRNRGFADFGSRAPAEIRPMNFFECRNLTEFTYECNPLKSPPLDLLAEDLGAVYKYFKLRSVRYCRPQRAITLSVH